MLKLLSIPFTVPDSPVPRVYLEPSDLAEGTTLTDDEAEARLFQALGPGHRVVSPSFVPAVVFGEPPPTLHDYGNRVELDYPNLCLHLITISFDDGWAEMYSATPVLAYCRNINHARLYGRWLISEPDRLYSTYWWDGEAWPPPPDEEVEHRRMYLTDLRADRPQVWPLGEAAR